jgi:hypothetical protein
MQITRILCGVRTKQVDIGSAPLTVSVHYKYAGTQFEIDPIVRALQE